MTGEGRALLTEGNKVRVNTRGIRERKLDQHAASPLDEHLSYARFARSVNASVSQAL